MKEDGKGEAYFQLFLMSELDEDERSLPQGKSVRQPAYERQGGSTPTPLHWLACGKLLHWMRFSVHISNEAL
jgi:hypothetical protein